jgi:hypothetical protein
MAEDSKIGDQSHRGKEAPKQINNISHSAVNSPYLFTAENLHALWITMEAILIP